MASVDGFPTNVTVVDDRAGNVYWICDVFHTTGDTTDIQVENSVISASELTEDGTRGGDITVTSDESATDAIREVTIPSGVTTGKKKIVIRFGGVAGSGSGREDL